MAGQKFDDDTIASIRVYLDLDVPIKKIQNWMKSKGLTISRAYLMKIKSGERKNTDFHRVKRKPGPKQILTTAQKRALERMALKKNPPSHRLMAAHFKVSKTSVHNYLNRLGLKLQ